MNWAIKRQLKYLALVLLFVVVVLGILLYPILTRKPTCSDKKQNGGELGIDCGGACTLVCPSSVIEPVVVWSRIFKVTGNFYNLTARIENRNVKAGVKIAPYVFEVFDKENKLIGTKEGIMYIPPNKSFFVFEPRFDAGSSVPRSVHFYFKENLVWEKKEDTVGVLPITADSIVFSQEGSVPQLQARIVNDSIYEIPPFDIVGVLYDINNNAVHVSKTHKEGLGSGKKLQANFTWPQGFENIPTTYEVQIQINPFTVSF